MGGCLLAASIVLPAVFHLLGLGQVFLPMHIPVLLAALVLRPATAVTVGVLAPATSMLLTGMPPAPFAAIMTVELLVLTSVASLAARVPRVPVWAAAAAAIAARCLATAFLSVALGRLFRLPAAAVGPASAASGVPGIIVQFIAVIPVASWIRRRALERPATWT